ncbi:MAG: D-aminoacyl-tRNA deacylase [Methanocorpusculum sp.]|nr:D-aminoacyl-tRNA deacylase [Methanocorpusculum sp.]
MIIDILNSEIDPAGKNIRAAIDSLIEENKESAFPLFENNEITFHTTANRIINSTSADVNCEADLIIVVSRHSSVNPVPVLTVHPAGNYGKAELGGNDNELGRTAPLWMKAVLQNHAKFVPEGYRVSYEITHHGPTDFPAPFFFVEVGSTEKEWNDEAAYTAAAKSVLYAKPSKDIVPLIGFGGTHYAVRQSAIGLNTKGAFGHIMHTRDTGRVTPETVKQMIEKSGGVSYAHVDKKSLSKSEISNIEAALKAVNLREITEGELMMLNSMSLKTWAEFGEFAKNVRKDIRIFPHGKIPEGKPVLVTLPEDLFSCAFLKNEEVLIEKLDSFGGVFHSTNPSGKLLPVFFTTESLRRNLSDYLIVLSIQQITRTQDCLVEDDKLTITRRQFDAESARNFGVPSGPLFGSLAAGKEVTVNGKTVTPEMVTKVTTTTIKIPGLEN